MSTSEHMIHSMDKPTSMQMPAALVVIVLALILGGATGFFSSSMFGKSTGAMLGGTPKNETAKSADGSVTSAGIKDTKVFKDSAEGTLKAGGFEDEGSFHLERPGGKDQYVYLTSSTVDLSIFVGKKVSVLGKTFEAEKAGWLMDVGYIELK